MKSKAELMANFLDASTRLATWARPQVIRFRREILIGVAMLLTLVAPYMLRPAQSTTPRRYDRRLVIMTPHHEKIRNEFAAAFAEYWKEKTGETLYIDWRVPGGTSEIAMFLKSEFGAAFENHWVNQLKRKGSSAAASGFLRPKTSGAEDSDITEAREVFLASEVGIGVDLLFGGGAYDFQQQAEAGLLVGSNKAKSAGPSRVRALHPDWFGDESIPLNVGGEPYRDPDDRWVGTCLSSFGIVFNRDVLRRLGVEREPTRWEDLADPRLLGQVALADPSKSGSVTKAFEMIIQQQMQKEIDALKKHSGKIRSPGEVEMDGVKRGWEAGLKLIQRITANARYFTDSATKIPLEVARGDAAAGMTIDFFGRSAEEEVRKRDGTSRVGFVTPVGGTSIGVDPIGMLRGAPEPELATAFIEFVLGEPGQSLWAFRAGVPGGPSRSALRRFPVRKDFYTEANARLMTDGKERPYDQAEVFVYHPEWTSSMFNSIRFLIRVTCIDVHQEQRAAWQALIEGNMPERALSFFHDTQLISYETTKNSISQVLKSRDKVQEVRLARKLSGLTGSQYQRTLKQARAGR
jgi:ABC-type Fe3+ transport system substrate-binding protein